MQRHSSGAAAPLDAAARGWRAVGGNRLARTARAGGCDSPPGRRPPAAAVNAARRLRRPLLVPGGGAPWDRRARREGGRAAARAAARHQRRQPPGRRTRLVNATFAAAIHRMVRPRHRVRVGREEVRVLVLIGKLGDSRVPSPRPARGPCACLQRTLFLKSGSTAWSVRVIGVGAVSGGHARCLIDVPGWTGQMSGCLIVGRRGGSVRLMEPDKPIA
jgi:hypothetical protein